MDSDNKTISSDNILFLGFADNKVPEFKEVKSKDWILYGEDNMFPAHLLYLYNKSSNHNAIVNGKVIYIFGSGFPTGESVVNSAGETFNKVFKKAMFDIELFGGCRFEIIWKNGGTAEMRHIPFQYLRRSKEDNGYWYSKKWQRYIGEKPVFIPDFNINSKKGAQIFGYNEYRPGTDIYPLPGYFGALNDIETDVEISKYNLSVIKNGMFASKMIVFNNGEPPNEQKRQIEADFKKKFAGSENSGNFMLVFNTDPAKAPTVQDLSTTDLDKLFDQLNKTTQAEIFSGHLVTSPMLFGIMEPGKLGGRNELQDAYEIFKNTYVQDKQNAANEIGAVLLPVTGSKPSEIEPVEAINLALNPVDFKEMLPKGWVMEKLGINPTLYGIMPEDGNVTGTTGTDMKVNENIKNLTGRQHIQMLRIVRQYSQGKITREQAALLLRSSLAMNENDINVMLGGENFEATEDEAAELFSEYGESKEIYLVVKSMAFNEDYIEFQDLSQIESNIIDQVKKDKNATPETIAKAIGSSTGYVSKELKKLKEAGVLKEVTKTVGIDKIIETVVNPEQIDYKPKPETVDIFIRYTYEKRPDAKGGEVIDTTRPFCKRLIELDRVYSSTEINQISMRLGYNVFDRGGGFWGKKDHCRHEWRKLVVIKKKK